MNIRFCLLAFGALVVFSNSINAAAAKPSTTATTAAKPWNECPDGKRLPEINFLVELDSIGIKNTGINNLETPDDPDLVNQLEWCEHFSDMIQNHIRTKVKEKHGYDSAKKTYKTVPRTNKFLLKKDGEIEEVHAAATAKPVGSTDVSKINKELQK